MVFLRKFVLGILVFFVATASGQDTSYTQLATIVVSANKLKEKRIESPVAISILSPKTVDARRETSRLVPFAGRDPCPHHAWRQRGFRLAPRWPDVNSVAPRQGRGHHGRGRRVLWRLRGGACEIQRRPTRRRPFRQRSRRALRHEIRHRSVDADADRDRPVSKTLKRRGPNCRLRRRRGATWS